MSFTDRLISAAYDMKQANFGAALKGLFINPSTYRGFDVENLTGTPSLFYDMIGEFGEKHFDPTTNKKIIEAFMDCPPLAAILNKKAQAYVNGKTWVVKTKGKGRDREATGEIATKLKKLLQQPNPKQTWKQFEADNYMITQMFGFCIVYVQKPVGFQNYDADAIWNIPPHIITINKKRGLFFKDKGNGIESVQITEDGETAFLPVDHLYVFRDLQPSFTCTHLPESRIRTLKMPINNIIGAYESRNTLINSRGALGMLTNQTQDSASFIPLKEDEKTDLHKDFKKLHGLKRGQSHVIITSANLKWQSMVLPTKDLMLFEEVEADIEQICDTYAYPFPLLSRGKGTTFSNMDSANVMLYQDAIIPESDIMYEQWDRLFGLAELDLVMEKDFSKVSALQAVRKQEAEAKLRMNQANQIAFRNNLITMNTWLMDIGEDPREGGDLYYSDIKDKIGPPVNNDNTQMNDNTNPGTQADGTPANDGTPGQQAKA